MSSPDIAGSAFFPPFDTCPGCGATGLEAIPASDQTHFFCPGCDCCWHIDLGWAHRVGPDSCSGCPRRGRPGGPVTG